MILNFKCYSEKNRDFNEVYYERGRFRECDKGNPMIVAGYNARESEDNLRTIKQALKQIPNSEVLIDKAGSFSIEIKEKDTDNPFSSELTQRIEDTRKMGEELVKSFKK